MVELNMKKLHRNYLGLESCFILLSWLLLLRVRRISPLVLVIAARSFNAKFPRGTIFS